MSDRDYNYSIKWFQVHRGKMVQACTTIAEVCEIVYNQLHNELVSEITITKIPQDKN